MPQRTNVTPPPHRMWVCVISASAFVLMMVVGSVLSYSKPPPVVNTDAGLVSGIVETTVKGRHFHSFYGIPFAQPPIGELRFKDPEAPTPWPDTHNASTPAPICPQQHSANILIGKYDVEGQEDCLYLNVFTPQVNRDGNLPVMVWLHGEAFQSGSAQEYRPHALLDHDVVLVVVQFRVGVLGFLTMEDDVMPGNLGLKDQTFALQWVQRNIQNFGGDNTLVTIFGESSGGASVHFQMMTPKAEGLFSGAIIQSGTALCPWAVNKNPAAATLQLAAKLGCPTDHNSSVLLTCLQNIDANVLAKSYSDFFVWLFLPLVFVPWVDGDYLPAHPAQLVRDGRFAHVDIMSGVNRDEGSYIGLRMMANKNLLEKLQSNFSHSGPASVSLENASLVRRVYHHYLGTTYPTEEHVHQLSRMFGDLYMKICQDDTAAYHAASLHPTKKTYMYELQYYSQHSLSKVLCPSCDLEMVTHADDLKYLFPGAPFLTPPEDGHGDIQDPEDLALRDIMTTLWTNFAAKRNPTPDDSLGFQWEPSTADNLHYLSLTPSPSMQPDNRQQARKFYHSLPYTTNLVLHPSMVECEAEECEDFGNPVKK